MNCLIELLFFSSFCFFVFDKLEILADVKKVKQNHLFRLYLFLAYDIVYFSARSV